MEASGGVHRRLPGPAQDPPQTGLEHKEEPREWGTVTVQRSCRAEFQRHWIGNDTLQSLTQKARGLEPLSKSGTKLMRLFLSPSVKVYYLYFKGSEQQRGWGEALFLPRTGAGNGRRWLGERVGGCPCVSATKRAQPCGA